MTEAKPFIFICGADDFLVGRAGHERFEELARDVDDEFSREVISGFANNIAEVAAALGRFRESVQTVSMFGGRRVVWLKDVNFLADTVTGRAEGTLALVTELQDLLASINPAEVGVLITAAPIDRRRAFPKWCEKTAEFLLVGGEGGDAADALGHVLLAEARALGARFEDSALQLLFARVGANSRLLLEETRKLATYASSDPLPPDGVIVINEDHVSAITPNVAEGDFFEATEAFFSGKLTWTLEALQRHFFAGGDSRPVLTSLQNRNRLLIQIRALVDSGAVRLGPRGLDKAGFDRASATYAPHFVGAGEKSTFNVFSQNPWYLGKLAGDGKLPTLRRLIDNQREFLNAFEAIIDRPREQEQVLREMTVRCLA